MKIKWSQDNRPAVLTVKYHLNVDCEAVGVELEALPGCKEQAAVAAYELGKLGIISRERAGEIAAGQAAKPSRSG